MQFIVGMDVGGAQERLSLPAALQALVDASQAQEVASVSDDDYSSTVDVAWALAHGVPWHDGLVARASHDAWLRANAAPFVRAPAGMGLLDPVHFRVALDHVELVDTRAVGVTDAERRALWASLLPWLESDGLVGAHTAHIPWLVSHPDLADLRTASVERATGRAVEDFPPEGAFATRWRRLQNELQMVLHDHPINDERAARRQPDINSVWLSGTGPWPNTTLNQPSLTAEVRTLWWPREDNVDPSMTTTIEHAAQTCLDARSTLADVQHTPTRATMTLCGPRRAVQLMPPLRVQGWRRWFAGKRSPFASSPPVSTTTEALLRSL